MRVHSLIQGSPEWHAHRPNYRNASDAPAMMGESKYETRSELLHRIYTGITPEIDERTQRRFDEGHRFEALARILAEEMIGEALYPVTGTEGKYSASFDGLTMCQDVIYEHKRLNDAIRAAQTVDDLDAMYHIQMEQQCLVSGAKKVLFLASNWDSEGNLLEKKEFWYEPNMELRERIVQGWEQFTRDLDAYVPVTHPEKPEADAVMQLPALKILIAGNISIISNLDLFGQKLNEFVGSLDLEPTDDQGFANAEAAVKTLQKARDALEAAEASALAQAADVDEMRRTVALYADTARKARLMLEKMVKARKEQIKAQAIAKAKEAFEAHIEALEEEIKPLRVYQTYKQPDFIGAAKNKRTLASLHDAVDTALANAKIAADATAKDVRTKLAWYKENAKGYEFLFADLQQIIFKEIADFQLLVQSRIAQHTLEKARALQSPDLVAEQRSLELVKKALEEQAKPVDAPKPTLVKTEPMTPEERIYPLMLDLAMRDVEQFRNKYGGIREVAGIIREIDLFLADQQIAEERRA